MLREKRANHCKVGSIGTLCSQLCKQAEPIDLPFGFWARMGPRNHVLDGVQIPRWEGAILVGRSAHCKVFPAVSSAKTAEMIDLPFGLCIQVGRKIHKFKRIRQVAPMCSHGRTHCRHLVNTNEPSVYGGDAPYVKLL